MVYHVAKILWVTAGLILGRVGDVHTSHGYSIAVQVGVGLGNPALYVGTDVNLIQAEVEGKYRLAQIVKS